MDEFLEYSIMKSPVSIEGSTMHIFLYVEDVDALVAQAIDAGAKELMSVEDHSEGSRDLFFGNISFSIFSRGWAKTPI